MDRFERVRGLRDDYESALDEAEKHRADYHREIVKLHRSGMSLREIADQLGISHQRVHQIVGVAEERRTSGRLVGGVAGAIVVLLAAGIWFALARWDGDELPMAMPTSSHIQPSLDHFHSVRIHGPLKEACYVVPSGNQSSFSSITMAAAATDCLRAMVVAIDPKTGQVVAVGRTSRHAAN